MTVLSQYERLECPAIWRADADAQRENVFVTLGKATLVIVSETEVALSHWSLPALERINPGATPAKYRPAKDSTELLEIDDETMVDAIETVRKSITRRQPHHGRLRGFMRLVFVVALIGLAILWVPGAIRAYTNAMLPQVLREDIGSRLLSHLVPVTGPACANRQSLPAVAKMSERLFGPGSPRVVVLSGGPVRSISLPGNMLLLHRELIEAAERAEVPAGYLIVEAQRAAEAPPLARLLDQSNLWTSVKLLTTGEIDEERLKQYAEGLPLSDAAMPLGISQAFTSAALSPAPYLDDLAFRGATLPDVTDQITAPEPVLSDANWVRLQDICAR
ncbi:MAG: hypothetical protein AAGF94_05495 [Pseudomonadota bacterium]